MTTDTKTEKQPFDSQKVLPANPPLKKPRKLQNLPRESSVTLPHGRPPKEFVEACRGVDWDAIVKAQEERAKSGDTQAAQWLASRAYGQPTQPIHETQGDEAPHDVLFVEKNTSPANHTPNGGNGNGGSAAK